MNDKDENSQLIDLIKVLHRGLRKHGVEKIVKALQHVGVDAGDGYYDDTFNFIIETVCEEIKISRPQLFAVKKESTYGRKLCVLLLRKHLSVSDETVANHFGRTRQVVHNIESEFKNLNPKFPADSEFLNVFYALNEKVEVFKKDLKNKAKDDKREESSK